MRFVMFYHSLISDWNHGNAHFLRGVVTELQERGHDVTVCEPRDAWSVQQLVAEHGTAPLQEFERAFPELHSIRYDPTDVDLDELTAGADVVLVHEWSTHELVRRVGECRRSGSFRLYFHDTHHRAVTDPDAMAAYDLCNYDGVLAYGEMIREVYQSRGWAENAWTWHEAADVRRFRPIDGRRQGDLVWVGNWGDDERAAELAEFMIEPARRLGLRAVVHGVRYPDEALAALRQAGISYGGWVANHEVPRIFAGHLFTVHVPRRPYVEALPGIPTIRPFEALACGIPLVCSPWQDSEGLFNAGEDYLVARDGREMQRHMKSLLNDADLRRTLSANGLKTIRNRHTCAHRVDQLLSLVGAGQPAEAVEA